MGEFNDTWWYFSYVAITLFVMAIIGIDYLVQKK
jgi:hypothetical protein